MAFCMIDVSAFALEQAVPLGDVLSALSGYMETNYFRAILVQGKEDADLFLLAKADNGLKVVVHSRSFALTGIGGSDAYLRLSQKGALEVVSLNEAIGRHRWKQTVTVVFREQQFLVAGYTYRYYDTIALDENAEVKTGICDVNLLTGRGSKNGKPILTSMKPVPAAQWNSGMRPPECVDD